MPVSFFFNISEKRKERAYKTALCPLFMAGKCLRGARCLFAHGEGELRPLSQVCSFFFH